MSPLFIRDLVLFCLFLHLLEQQKKTTYCGQFVDKIICHNSLSATAPKINKYNKTTAPEAQQNSGAGVI